MKRGRHPTAAAFLLSIGKRQLEIGNC